VTIHDSIVGLLADAGVPMIFVTLPLMLVALAPIVLLEALVIQKTTGTSWRAAAGASFVANLLSTIAGIPATWFLLFGLDILVGTALTNRLSERGNNILSVTLGAPWFAAPENQYWWMIPTAQLFLLAPFFLVSYLIERWLTAYWLRDEITTERAYRASWYANCWSYGGLAVFVLGYLVFSYFHRN
jgi:hypothetical protein